MKTKSDHPEALSRIRNFSIIAHIDHGKSTLADRILEKTGALSQREMTDQVLDQMDLERERGITIKAQAVRLDYRSRSGQEVMLNLIDTPGHVDFTYEVSRSLAACEGALLVVDATQGVEAQTLANLYLALEHDLTVIPVINKIDLPSADPQRVQAQLGDIGFLPDEVLLASAKEGIGIEDILEAVVERVPPPGGDPEAPLAALVMDSYFDSYRGVIVYLRVKQGIVRVGDRIRFMAGGGEFDVTELGVFRPRAVPVRQLASGEVGYLAAAIKNVKDARVGDTVTLSRRPTAHPLPGYRPVTPMVYAGIYPVDSSQYGDLREALEKLQLNDASLVFEPETSAALGFGFRAGFLGLLHLEIIQERLEREYGLALVTTAPSVTYKIQPADGEWHLVQNPADIPAGVHDFEEPFVKATVITPSEFVGAVMDLCQERRGNFINMEYPDPSRAVLTYHLPLAEIMFDFFDQLKSRSRGYASLDYEFLGYQASDLVKVDILLNGEPVDALSFVVHRQKAQVRGRVVCERLRDLIPRQMFEVPVQAAIGGKVIARETIRAMRKDVLAKCYGGDITRKRKLLEKQKEGKKRMKQVGAVEVPQEAFLSVLKGE